MDGHRRLVESLITELRRAIEDGVTVERLDILTTLAERVLRAFVLLVAVNPSNDIENYIVTTQNVLSNLNDLTSALEDRNLDPCGYHPSISFTGTRGRPKVQITEDMLSYFFSHGFSASTTAMLLHVSLSTIRRRMNEYGVRIRDAYSSISDQELDRIVTFVQHHNPNCGYRMMQGYLQRFGHRVQQIRVREAMARTDPDGLVNRWCHAVQRRSYSVPTPNALWHIDGHHRLIRYYGTKVL